MNIVNPTSSSTAIRESYQAEERRKDKKVEKTKADRISDLLVEINEKFDNDSDAPLTSDKLNFLFNSLSKTLQQASYSGREESILKDMIFEEVKNIRKASNATEMVNMVTSSQDFKYDSRLAAVIFKVDYMAKGRFDRFIHHLEKNLGNLPVMSKGAAYILGGAAMVGVGINSFPSNYSAMPSNSNTTSDTSPDQGKNLGLGIAYIATGLGFVCSPFVGAYRASAGDQP